MKAHAVVTVVLGCGRTDHWSANRLVADQGEGQVNGHIRITRKEVSRNRTGKSVIQERCGQRADAPHGERPLTGRAGFGRRGSSGVQIGTEET
jgi:hypothetical protein